MQTKSIISVGFCEILTLIFVVLKLLDKIDWSWWWVLSPILIPLGLTLGVIAVTLIFMLIVAGIAFLSDDL